MCIKYYFSLQIRWQHNNVVSIKTLDLTVEYAFQLEAYI